MNQKAVCILMFFGCLFLAAGCASAPAGTEVERVDSSTNIDLSGYWNDTDVRIVCDSLISECISSPRVARKLADIESATGELPVAIVGTFRNNSDEHLDTGIISKKMEAALINSGRVDFVAGGNAREEIRSERKDQQVWADENTAKELAGETGADIILQGTLTTIVDRANGKTVRSYQVYAELIDIETGRKLWIGENDSIKKVITRPSTRF